MKQYQELLRNVLNNGTRQSNRTGVDTIFTTGEMMKFDLTKGFPVLTTRKYNIKPAIAEMIGFINAATSAAHFRDLGCNFWNLNANANEQWLANPNRQGEDDLGEIYGWQARNWKTEELPYRLDQFKSVISDLIINPTSRRLLVSHWRPDRFNKMALPPCHVLYQFIANTKTNELNMMVYMRSNDLFLGAPANIVEYAWLLEVVAMAVGMDAKTLTYFIADAHIYVNHVEQVGELLIREPLMLPRLDYHGPLNSQPISVMSTIEWLENLRVDDFSLVDYKAYGAISAPMAV